jgi:hypothetical protein
MRRGASRLSQPVRLLINRWIKNQDRQRFHSEGYMVIRNVVPACAISHAVREIAAFLRVDLDDSTTWYRSAPVNDGIVPLHHAQSLWDIRQSANLYEVFREFWGTHRLMVDINRCLFRPPRHPSWPTISQGDIHWDTDPRAGGPGSLQGVVLLTDVDCDGGGYQCLPNIYQNLEVWLDQNARQRGFDFFNPGLKNCRTTQIEGKAGDVILWSTKLPHGSAANLSHRPRIAAFVSMHPAADSAELRASMKKWWLTKQAPDYWRGLPGQLETEPGAPAVLSELGLKLIGVLPWD